MVLSNKKYIKNCTGDNCGTDHSKGKAFSKTVSRVIFRILLLTFFGVSVYVLFFSQYLRITNINISGTQELKNGDIEQTLNSYLDGKYLNIIPKNNLLLVSQQKIASLLEDNYKKIRAVSAVKKFPDSMAINIDERKALLVWCAGSNCFLVDENGVAYNVADFNSPEITQNHLIKIMDLSERGLSLGEKIIDPAYEQYALGIKDALSGVGQEVSYEACSTPSSMADEIDVKTVQGMQIYFSTQFPLESAVNMLSVVWKKEIPQNQQANVDYVDLRSEGRVYYKLKRNFKF